MFSVLISIYQKESPAYFKASLNSVISQRVLPSEIVIVKDGRLTQELDQVITDFSKIFSNLKVQSLPINQGLGRALNEGLKHCSFDLVARMDADDIAKPDRFEKQLNLFRLNPDIDIVGAWIDEFEDSIDKVKSIRRLPERHDEIFSYAKHRNPLNHPVVMFKKQAVLDAGGYLHFPLFEDYYLWIRMLMNGSRFYNIQESLLFFRFTPNVFKRRGGLKYAIDELKFQYKIKCMGFVSTFSLIKNAPLRFVVRIIPVWCRSFLYIKILRK